MIRKILPCTALLTTVAALGFSLVSCTGTTQPDPEETVTIEAPAWQAARALGKRWSAGSALSKYSRQSFLLMIPSGTNGSIRRSTVSGSG